MPPSNRRPELQSTNEDVSDRLRPYVFHGVQLSSRSVMGGQATGDCPFCGRDGKFTVEVATGQWRCFVCASGNRNGGGNGLVFTRLIHEQVSASTAQNAAKFTTFAQDRRLLSPTTLASWGVCVDPGGTWLVPGYNPEGRLDQVYRRKHILDRGEWVWRLLPTPGIWPDGKVHALHLPTGDFDPSRPNIVICEGPWDAMVLWEVWDRTPGDTNIIAVPGCNVWREEWTQLCRGKNVTLLYDSDHPREVVPGSGRVWRAGYDGMVRVAKRLSGAAASVRWLRWGPEGYDPDRASGYDVRDHLTRTGKPGDERQVPQRGRIVLLDDLRAKVEDAPAEWFLAAATHSLNGSAGHGQSLEALACSDWKTCEDAWKTAMLWRDEMSDAMSVLLSICASTAQAGNQLFLDLIGSPGSAKTTMCRGLLVSSSCVHVENISKILSGFKKPGEGDKDCSFLARANGKTWVTCEFDTLATLPQYHELMGKIRRIFDGETSATYGNDDRDRVYTALRTPWIRAGTPKMMDHDQSQLGDRFLRFIIGDPERQEKRNIALAALRSERAAMLQQSNSLSGSILDEKTQRAHALTGGYVDWLRANIEERIGLLTIPEYADEHCVDLAELSADLRARPTDDKKRVESYDVRELPTRLARQNIRLASCLAVALNKSSVDAEVLRVVRKVALDTASGNSLNIVKWLCCPNPKAGYKPYQETGGIAEAALTTWCSMVPERMTKYLSFLRKIDVLEPHHVNRTLTMWRLTDRVYTLYQRILKG